MDDQVKQIFVDAGATPVELALIETALLATALEVRGIITEASNCFSSRPELVLPLRVLLCRIIHADMEKAFTQYRTIPNDT